MTSKHEFNAYLDMQDIEEPSYHEQLAVMQELELDREESRKEQGAIDALVTLRSRLMFFLNAYKEHYRKDDSVGNYSALLSYQTAIETLDCEVEKHQRWLKQTKGGVL